MTTRTFRFLLLATLATTAIACGDDTADKSAETASDADSGGDADAGVDGSGEPGDADADVPFAIPSDWCDDEAPDDACFAARRDPESDLIAMATAIADKVVETVAPADLAWNWEEAVMLLGVTRTGRVTGDTKYLDYVAEYVDHHIAEGYELETSDTSAPAALAVALIADGRDEPRYRAVVDEALEYYASEAMRTPEGGISHFGTLELFGAQLWADSLFMFGNVMTGWGVVDSDLDWLDAYAEQYAIFAELMQDDVGFFRHAVYASFEQDPGVFWARANGWVLAAGYDHLAARVDRREGAAEVAEPAAALAAAVMDTQDPDTGLWWTVPDRPGETYLETSASALFAFGLARAWRYGFVGDEALDSVEAAVRGVLGRVRWDWTGRPVIGGISGPTSVGGFEYYAGIPLIDDAPFGVGAVLLALTEASGLAVDVDVPGGPPEPVAAPEGTEVSLEPTDGFLARRAEFYDFCVEHNDPGRGGIYGQSCRVAANVAVDPAPIRDAIAHMEERRDVSDFRANGLVRLLYLDDETGALDEELRDAIDTTLFEFKYWLDEPGDDGMAYWTENHQVLFHTAELLIGQRHPDDVFPNAGMTGREHMEHARPRLIRWLQMRGRYGFSEWHSPVYFNEDLPAVLNLFDFAEDPEIRQLASMVLDVMAIDLATNMFQGAFATTAGRIYRSRFIGGNTDSTAEFAWMALGLGDYSSAGNFAGAFLATSTWFPAPPVEELAADIADGVEHRQRDSFDIEEGPVYAGVSYEGLDDIVVWAGQSAIVAPAIIDGAMEVIEEFDLWDGFLFGSLPDSVLNLIRGLVGTPGLRGLAEDLGPLARGMALEGVDTYVFRTPNYQMAVAQDWKPGMWSAQTLMYRASVSGEVSIMTNAPALLGGLGSPDDVTVDDPWIGGWHPRVTAHRSAAVVQYHRPAYAPVVDTILQGEAVHAYFPVDAMDEWDARDDGWLVGRVGDSYVGLWSETPLTQVAEVSYEWTADTPDNVFVVQLGSADEFEDFAAFVEAIADAPVSVTEEDGGGSHVTWDSPLVGVLDVGWTGELTVDGRPVDLGPYPRFDSPNVQQIAGTDRLVVDVDGSGLVLDFATRDRIVLALD